MRVLHVLRDLSRNGGVQRLVFDLASLGGRTGWTTEVVIFHREIGPEYVDELRTRGVQVHVLAPWQFFRQWSLYRRADVVHAHLFPALYLVGLMRPGSIYTEHNTTNNRRTRVWLRPLERWMYARYRRITCISPEVRASLLDYLGCVRRDNTVTLYNGVDVQALAAEAARIRNSEGFGSTRDTGYHVAMVGSLTPKKDQETLVRALALLSSDTHLHLAGEGPQKSMLTRLARSLQIEDRVHLHGVIANVAKFLADKDLYVQSSKWEGFGLAAIEAMACGVPTLCADVPGLNNLSAERAHLFEMGQVDCLAKAIEHARYSQDFRSHLVGIARKTASIYSMDAFSASIEKVYREVESGVVP